MQEQSGTAKVSTGINKSAFGARQLLQSTPRIVLAVLIGIVIASPLELNVFEREIREQRLPLSVSSGYTVLLLLLRTKLGESNATN